VGAVESEQVIVVVSTLRGSALRYAMAQARGMPFTVHPPVYGSGHRILVEGDQGFFRADVDWKQAGPLIDRHWRTITTWLIEHLGPNWRDNVDGEPGDVLLWLARGYVGGLLGDTVTVPLDIVAHPSS